jgi:hypothetical protein
VVALSTTSVPPPLVAQPVAVPYSRLPLPAKLRGDAVFVELQAAALQNPLQVVSLVQLVPQVGPLALHWYALQEVVAPALQTPAPLQVEAALNVELVQPAAWQTVPATYFLQAPAPSHVPSCPHEETGSAEQSLRTSVPGTAGVHWPRVPTPPQVMHAAVQALSQQTPSTQKPLWQAPAAPQAVPFVSCAAQTPAEQKVPAAQSVSEVQVVAHDVAPHRYGAQETVVAVRQVPVPLHVRAGKSVAPLQVSLVQPVPAR